MCVKARFYAKICQLITEIKTSYENNRKQCLHIPNVGNIHLYILQIYKIINVNTRSCMRFKG